MTLAADGLMGGAVLATLAVLDRFSTGLKDAGHANEIVDLYAIGFDPILRERDTPSWLTEPFRMRCSSGCGYARISSTGLADR